MGAASFVQDDFSGGEWSAAASARISDPRYKTALSVSLNGMPVKPRKWTRRPGSRWCYETRGGAPGRVLSFDFKENSPYTMELTDGYLRFRSAYALVTTNEIKTIAGFSSANPTVVETTAVHGWATGDQVIFGGMGTSNVDLKNRVCAITVTDTTHFSIVDAVSGASIDGAAFTTAGTVTKVLEIATPYTSGSWATLRQVQDEKRAILLNAIVRPYVLQVETNPSPASYATFSFSAADLLDGPYLDPIAGTIMTPATANGVVTFTLSTQAYDSSRAYSIGEFATYSAVVYKSLVANNQGNTPSGSPSYWSAVQAGSAIGANGFQLSDIGRSIRFLSEPQQYDAASTYSSGNTVSYPTATDGVSVYYQATTSILANELPGTSAHWALSPNLARWTWGVIQGISGSGLVVNDTAIGGMTAGGGIAAAFDGTSSHSFSGSASATNDITAYPIFNAGLPYGDAAIVYYGGLNYQCVHGHAFWNPTAIYNANDYVISSGNYYVAKQSVTTGQAPGAAPAYWEDLGGAYPGNTAIWVAISTPSTIGFDDYIGQHYSTASAIERATVYPATDIGFANVQNGENTLVYLRAKATAPSSASDGTQLAVAVVGAGATAPITLISSDQITTWHYVWIEVISSYTQPIAAEVNNVFSAKRSVSQVYFYTPNVANGSVITAQIRGDALLYVASITTWRLGAFSDTTGWPTCGSYHEGRLWLATSAGHYLYSSKAAGNHFDFSPTSALGDVADDNAITYALDAPGINSIFWIEADLQGLKLGTQDGEFLVQASALNSPMTPTNIWAHKVTKIGCANVLPAVADMTLLFVQKHQRQIMEYFADVFSGKFTAPDLNENAQHLTASNIEEIAYQRGLWPVLWGRRGDGALIGMTYKRDTLMTSSGPAYNGWSRHTLGSSRLVESLCVSGSASGTLSTAVMVTNDVTTNIRHVEMLSDPFEEGDALTKAWFMDDATDQVVYTTATVLGGASGIIISGLTYLNGKTVSVFAGGLDLGDYAISSGQVQVPFLTSNALFTAAFVSAYSGVMPIVVGFCYNSDGQLLRPDTIPESGARSGPGFGKWRRINAYAVSLVATQKIKVGTDFTKLNAAQLKTIGGTLLAANALYTGVHRDEINDSGEGFDSRICWRSERMFPATIAAIGGFIETKDK